MTGDFSREDILPSYESKSPGIESNSTSTNVPTQTMYHTYPEPTPRDHHSIPHLGNQQCAETENFITRFVAQPPNRHLCWYLQLSRRVICLIQSTSFIPAPWMKHDVLLEGGTGDMMDSHTIGHCHRYHLYMFNHIPYEDCQQPSRIHETLSFSDIGRAEIRWTASGRSPKSAVMRNKLVGHS